jgi:superfamily II DNA or RNA helicase
VKHSIHLRDEFNKAGITSYHLDAKSPDDERNAVFNDMEKGNIKVICNVALYQEGMDVPDISCVVMARPTKSMGLYRQCAGRGMRISQDADDMILLDHGGVVEEHGLLTDNIDWTLVGKV